MKAKGNSGSRRFSARLKCTRPTRRQRRSRFFRKVLKRRDRSRRVRSPAPAPISRQSDTKPMGRRYSPPSIGGDLVEQRAVHSAAEGAGRTRLAPLRRFAQAQSSATKRMAKSRHQARAGGRALPASHSAKMKTGRGRSPRAKVRFTPLCSPSSSGKFVFGQIEAKRAMRRQNWNKRRRHSQIPEPYLFAPITKLAR